MMGDEERGVSRRQLLAGTGGVGLMALAGCTGDGDSSEKSDGIERRDHCSNDEEVEFDSFPSWKQVQEASDVGCMTTLGREGAYANYMQAQQLKRQNDIFEAFARAQLGSRFVEQLQEVRQRDD